MNSGDRFIATTADKDIEWPQPVKAAFLQFWATAREHDFSVLCAVGFNLANAKAGHTCITSFFSPSASRNPHQAEMLQDISNLFRASVERSKQ